MPGTMNEEKQMSKPASKPTGAARAAVKKTGFTTKKPAASRGRRKELGDEGFVPLPPRVSTTCQRYLNGHNVHFMVVMGNIRHHKSKPCKVLSVADDGTIVVKIGRKTLTLWSHDPTFLSKCVGPNGAESWWYESRILMVQGPDGTSRGFQLGEEPSECTYIERPTFNEEYYAIRREDDPAEDDPDNWA